MEPACVSLSSAKDVFAIVQKWHEDTEPLLAQKMVEHHRLSEQFSVTRVAMLTLPFGANRRSSQSSIPRGTPKTSTIQGSELRVENALKISAYLVGAISNAREHYGSSNWFLGRFWGPSGATEAFKVNRLRDRLEMAWKRSSVRSRSDPAITPMIYKFS
jgi:hypothetical protein